MPAKKTPPRDEKPQKQRFEEAARKAEVDPDKFERAMERIAPPKRPAKK
jgi:hypothetical protein